MICEGRVVVVTGAGRGIGRAHAIEFARQGASVVVNDLGATLDGQGRSSGPAEEVAEEIRSLGGEAVVDGHDVADWEGSGQIVQTALDRFGRLDVVVNNAGFVRDRMFANVSEDEWDAVVRVHLKGHFCVARWAAAHWRDRAKAGDANDARIINTSSGAGLLGSVGQAAYSAAKGAILSLTLVQAAELARYGVTANAIAPAARTRMTEEVFAATMKAPEVGAFDAMAPDNVAPLVVWLGSSDSAGVTGRVFEVEGGKIGVADGWQHGPTADKGARWDPAEVGPAVRELLAAVTRPGSGLRSRRVTGLSATPPYVPGHGLLAGRTVVVTAAAGTGIGFATAQRCIEEGATVVISDAHERRLGEAADRLADTAGTPPVSFACDVTVESDVQALVEDAVAALGRIDVMVNNAGLGGTADLVDMTDEQWAKVVDVTLNGTFRCTRAALRQMRDQGDGVIVNNASVLGWRAQAGQSHYAAAKAGVMALTRCVAVEAAAYGVRINAVAPSLAMHPFLAKVTTDDLLQDLTSREAFGRAAEPWEVANVIVFLASPYSSYLTGEVVSVSSQHP